MPRSVISPLSNEDQFLADSLAETIEQVHKLKGAVLTSAPGPDRQKLLEILERHMVST